MTGAWPGSDYEPANAVNVDCAAPSKLGTTGGVPRCVRVSAAASPAIMSQVSDNTIDRKVCAAHNAAGAKAKPGTGSDAVYDYVA